MRTTRLILLLPLLPGTAFGAGEEPAFEAAKELYITKCSSCHSVGEGDRVGPDLKGVVDNRARDWLVRMIVEPTKMLASDPDARALLAKFSNVKMPDLGMSEEQAEVLVGLIERCSSENCELKGKLVPVTEATPLDVKTGHDLFVGRLAQTNGGPACISCHTAQGAYAFISGGLLARDLTNTFARFGDDGLDAALKNPAFPGMSKVYAERPLTADEVFALRAFLHTTNRGALDELEGSPAHSMAVPFASLLIVIVVLVLLNAAWSRRMRGVRKPLVRKKGLRS